MLGLKFTADQPGPVILCLGAHCDDIELGCGATLRKLREQYPQAQVHWVVLSSTPEREAEARRCALRWMPGPAPQVQIFGFRDGYLPYEPVPVKERIAGLAATIAPDLVFTHAGHDRHQDHRFVSELTWNHFREHLVLEYEIPKYDGDLGQPNLFVPVTREACERKAADIVAAFVSQRGKGWLSPDTVLALARLRGIESRSPTGYAEGFFARKLLLA